MAEKICTQGHVMAIDNRFCSHCNSYANTNVAADIAAKAVNNVLPTSSVVVATRKH